MLRAGEIAGAGLDVFEHGHEINPRACAPCRPRAAVVMLARATVRGRIEMGEKGDLQYPHLRRRPAAAGSCPAEHAVTQAAGPVPRDGGVIDARWAVSGLFIANGLMMGSWAPKLPVLMQRLQITEGVAGLLVLMLGLGAVSMMPVFGAMVTRATARRGRCGWPPCWRPRRCF